MARLFVLGLLLAARIIFLPHGVAAASPSDQGGTSGQFSVQTVAAGNEFFAVGKLSVAGPFGANNYPLPTGHRYVSCYYSNWYLINMLPDGSRQYDIVIWDACTNQQVFPPSTCDFIYRGYMPSECVTLPPRTVPAGYTPATCGASAVTSSKLFASVTPTSYDPTQATPLTATTAFAGGFANSLSDGTCTSVLNWDAVSWKLTWPDGQGTTAGDSGQGGITSSHTLAPQPGVTGSQKSDVTAIAHVHITGEGVAFDAAGNPTVIPVDTFVDVSNKATAAGLGPPTYTPPVLRVGGIGDGQTGDGSIPAANLALAPSQHLTTIRGHLLLIYPRAIVVTPGTESIGGVPVGNATTTTASWRYDGSWTNTPPGAGTAPGGNGGNGNAVVLQWNNPEPLNALGQPVDEQAPITITAQTTYPDGHTATETVSGSVGVTIYYIALGYAG
jgi:hypothetical protein